MKKKTDEMKDIEIGAKLDLQETEEILTILENMDNEELGASLLKEFNDASKDFSQVVLTIGGMEQTEKMKRQYEAAKGNLVRAINKIKKYK